MHRSEVDSIGSSLTWKKREFVSPKRWTLYIGNELWREVSCSIISKESDLYELQRRAASYPDLLQRFQELEEKGAYIWAIKQLSRRALFERDLERTLQRHSVSLPAIEKTIQRVKDRGWLNDEERKEALIAQMRQRGKSSLEIQKRLKGRMRSLSPCGEEEGAITLQDQHGDDEQALVSLIEKRYAKLLQGNLDQKSSYKLVQRFLRRGFSYGLIQKVLERFKIKIDSHEG